MITSPQREVINKEKEVNLGSKEINDLVFGMSTKTMVLGGEVRIYRGIGMRQAFIYDVKNETVITVDTKNKWAPIRQNIYEFMEDFGASHMGSKDVTFEDVCEAEVLTMLEWGSNKQFPASSKLFDECFKPKTGFLDIFQTMQLN